MEATVTDKDTMERKAYRVPEFAKATGLSRACVYQLVEEKRLRAVRVGRAILIPASAVDAFLAGGPNEVGA
jgi:excisionase family DNA binding protein